VRVLVLNKHSFCDRHIHLAEGFHLTILLFVRIDKSLLFHVDTTNGQIGTESNNEPLPITHNKCIGLSGCGFTLSCVD
jgi:hypothetical protein